MKRYFAYDPNDGFETFDTIEARDKWVEHAIELHLDDGWSEDVEQVCVGEITGRAVQCDVQPKPKREDVNSDEEYEDALADWGGDPMFDSICNYKIRPTSETKPCPHGNKEDECAGCDGSVGS
jgi:hypothetical protein